MFFKNKTSEEIEELYNEDELFETEDIDELEIYEKILKRRKIIKWSIISASIFLALCFIIITIIALNTSDESMQFVLQNDF